MREIKLFLIILYFVDDMRRTCWKKFIYWRVCGDSNYYDICLSLSMTDRDAFSRRKLIIYLTWHLNCNINYFCNRERVSNTIPGIYLEEWEYKFINCTNLFADRSQTTCHLPNVYVQMLNETQQPLKKVWEAMPTLLLKALKKRVFTPTAAIFLHLQYDRAKKCFTSWSVLSQSVIFSFITY